MRLTTGSATARPTAVRTAALLLGLAIAGGCGSSEDAEGADSDPGPTDLPCAVQDMLVTWCSDCHGSKPTGGAPVSLVTRSDLLKASKDDPSLTQAELSIARMNDAKDPMPPGGGMPAADIAALQEWIDQGTPAQDCGKPVPEGGVIAPLVCSSSQRWTEGDEGDEEMYPGQACAACHKDRDKGPTLLIAGTVYPTLHEEDDCNGLPNVEVEVTDGNGKVHKFTTSRSGNFFLDGDETDVLKPPITARVLRGGKVSKMEEPVMTGDCNTCHSEQGAEGAPGRIIAP